MVFLLPVSFHPEQSIISLGHSFYSFCTSDMLNALCIGYLQSHRNLDTLQLLTVVTLIDLPWQPSRGVGNTAFKTMVEALLFCSSLFSLIKLCVFIP